MFSESGPYLEEQFRRWQDDPASVDPTWQAFFAGMQFAGRLPGAGAGAAGVTPEVRVQTGVVRLLNWYRQAGHLQADTDPLA
ncbi:MAG: 2-oxoglutarate dehydrogenase E1 subunit family protein, partial [Gemmata sp.]